MFGFFCFTIECIFLKSLIYFALQLHHGFFSFFYFTVEFNFSKSLVSFVLKSRILKSRIFLFLGESVEGVVSKVAGGSLEEVNLFVLSNQATNKDMSLKMTSPKVSSADNDSEISEEEIWSKNKYFKDETSEMNFGKTDYSVSASLHQAYLTVTGMFRPILGIVRNKKFYVNFISKNYFSKMF